MDVEYFQHLAEYAAWANARALESLQSVDDPRALRVLAHVLEAERIYLARVRGDDPWPQDFWPELSFEECAALAAELPELYGELLLGLTAEDLAARARYRNSRGEEFYTPVADLLTHVFMHGSYHRGQIAAAVRRAGGSPASTDYITFTRR